MARRKGAAAPAPARKGKAAPGGLFLVLGIVAGAVVLLLGSVVLASQSAGVGRVQASSLPGITVGLAVLVAVFIATRIAKPRHLVIGFAAAVLAGGLVTANGNSAAVGSAMASLGSRVQGSAPGVSCPPAPAGHIRATSPGGTPCVAVRKCPAGKERQWHGERPVGGCVRKGSE